MFRRSLRTLAKNFAFALALATSSFSCADLQYLEKNACGNFVIDSGEDCDGHPLEAGTKCGAVDTPRACRQICEATTECPKGWGCGSDGICRVPTGSFSAVGSPIPLGTPNLMYRGDFDQDRATDILLLGHENGLGTRPARIAYTQDGNVPAELRPLSLNLASPVLGELDEDGGMLDVAFATQSGVSLFRGAADRTTQFGVFPYFNIPEGLPFRIFAMDVLPEVLGDELLVLADQMDGRTVVSAFQESGNTPLFELNYPTSKLAGQVQRGHFDESGPCEQLVIAQIGAKNLFVYSPCRTDGTSGWNTNASPVVINLPMGITIDKGVLVEDFDLDGNADILIETNGLPHMAWGTGLGTFKAENGGLPLNEAGPYLMPKGGQTEFPLAAADMNGDGLIDFVFPHGLFVSRNNDNYVFVYDNFGGAWSSVVVADMNGNGLLDVVAGSDESVDCTFLNNAGDGIFNAATISTSGRVQFLASADFDGDLLMDVAVLNEYPDPLEAGNSQLLIGFGRSHGPPEQLVPMGVLENPSQLVAMQVHDLWENPNATDNISDLLALDQHEHTEAGAMGVNRHAVLFRGDGTRVLRTSRPLRDSDHADLPLAIGIAKSANEKAAELAALGIDRLSGDLHIWTIEGAEADLARPGPLFPPGFHSATGTNEISFRYGAYMASGDLYGDASDEIVVVAPFGPETDGAALVVADYSDSDDTFTPRMPQQFPAMVTVDNKFELHDIDGDGFLDGVLSTGTHEEPGPLLVFWGNGQGLDTTSPSRLAPLSGIADFACLSLATDCPLGVTNANGTYRVNFSVKRTLALDRVPDVPGGAALAAGDFNRDGLVDIAMHAPDGLVYYHAVPVNQ